MDEELIWTIDELNDGLPRLMEVSYDKFEDWDRDKWGYPLNKSVWKIDENNDGLPWLMGFPYQRISYLPFFKMN